MTKPLPTCIKLAMRTEVAPQTSSAFVAWAGGSRPAPYVGIHKLEASLVVSLYHAQVASFNAFWGKDPDNNTRELYWTRARFDAHATFRAGVALNGIPADYVNTEPPLISEPADGY